MRAKEGKRPLFLLRDGRDREIGGERDTQSNTIKRWNQNGAEP